MAYEFERDEWKSAVAAMSELERVQACRHSAGHVRGICPDCGHDVRSEL
jgi:hypothetical protein